MDYVNLGNTGLKVSRICLGCMSYGDPEWRDWVLPEKDSLPFFERALELGINFFDTADMYSLGVSEEITGRALKELADDREDVVLATKVYFPMGDGPNDRGLSRKHILASIDASLKRLGTDYVDLYQIHRFDPETPLEETLEALNTVVEHGKARYIGASSMAAWQLATALYTADALNLHRFVSMQNHYNLVYREEEREMLPLCQAEGLGVIPWSPLARGFLAGNRKRGDETVTKREESDTYARDMYYQDADFEVVDRVVQLAAERRAAGETVTPAQIALAWLLHQPAVTAPIVGATKIEHLEQAVGALEVELSEEDLERLEEPYRPHPVLGH